MVSTPFLQSQRNQQQLTSQSFGGRGYAPHVGMLPIFGSWWQFCVSYSATACVVLVNGTHPRIGVATQDKRRFSSGLRPRAMKIFALEWLVTGSNGNESELQVSRQTVKLVGYVCTYFQFLILTMVQIIQYIHWYIPSVLCSCGDFWISNEERRQQMVAALIDQTIPGVTNKQ